MTVEVFDAAGRSVGTRTVTADSGGQWLAPLPSDSYTVSDAATGRVSRSLPGSRMFAGDDGVLGAHRSPLGFARSAVSATIGSSLGQLPTTTTTVQSAPAADLLGAAARSGPTSPAPCTAA